LGPFQRSLTAALLLTALPALSCALPDEGNAPLRRMVSKVKYLPETEAWQATLPDGVIASFLLSADAPIRISGRCYWPVEARAAGIRWTLFYVSADGKRMQVARPGKHPVPLAQWRRLSARRGP
jgi:hypothetical protein